MMTTIRRHREFPFDNTGIEGFLRLPRSFRTLVTIFVGHQTE
jgi:hypothetical protein